MSRPVSSEQPDQPEVHVLGIDGLRVRFGSSLSEAANRAALAFRAALEADAPPGVEEAATSLTSVYLRFSLADTDHAQLTGALQPLLDRQDWYQADLPRGRRLWRVPAVFGTKLAPQLPEVAAKLGLTPEDATAALCAAPLRVQTIGFAPGQPYLGELPPEWDIPRQTDLTPRVPEGALVVAIRQVVLFSVSTPTGWWHVGQTALRLFRPDAAEPFLLRPGDELRFHGVSPEELDNIRDRDPEGGAVSERLD